MPPSPVAQALCLCDRIIVEEGTRKVTLVGLFARVALAEVPAALPPFGVYALLTDSEGAVPLELSISHLESSIEVFAARQVLTFPSRLREVRCIFRINACRVPAFGTYQIALQAGNDPVAHTILRVHQRGVRP